MSHCRRPAALEMGLGRKYDGWVFPCGVLPIWSYCEVEVVEFGAAERRIRPKPKGTATGCLMSDSAWTGGPFISGWPLSLKTGAPSKDFPLGA